MSVSTTSMSICAFAASAAAYVGYRNVTHQLKQLQTEIIQCNRRDFSNRLDFSEDLSTKNMDLLLEMHSVISHGNVEGILYLLRGIVIVVICDCIYVLYAFLFL